MLHKAAPSVSSICDELILTCGTAENFSNKSDILFWDIFNNRSTLYKLLAFQLLTNTREIATVRFIKYPAPVVTVSGDWSIIVCVQKQCKKMHTQLKDSHN